MIKAKIKSQIRADKALSFSTDVILRYKQSILVYINADTSPRTVALGAALPNTNLGAYLHAKSRY